MNFHVLNPVEQTSKNNMSTNMNILLLGHFLSLLTCGVFNMKTFSIQNVSEFNILHVPLKKQKVGDLFENGSALFSVT